MLIKILHESIFIYISALILLVVSAYKIDEKRSSLIELVKDPFILAAIGVTLTIVLRMPCYSLLWLLALVVMIGVFGLEVLAKKVKLEVELVVFLLVIAHLTLYFLID